MPLLYIYIYIYTCCWIITSMSKCISDCHIILSVWVICFLSGSQAQKTLSLHQRLALGEYQPDHLEYVRESASDRKNAAFWLDSNIERRKDERSWDWCMVRCRVLSSQRQRSRYCFSIIHGYVATTSTLHHHTFIHPEWSSRISWNFVVTPVASFASVLLKCCSRSPRSGINSQYRWPRRLSWVATTACTPSNKSPKLQLCTQNGTFCDYACSKHLLQRFSVTQGHQLGSCWAISMETTDIKCIWQPQSCIGSTFNRILSSSSFGAVQDWLERDAIMPLKCVMLDWMGFEWISWPWWWWSAESVNRKQS